MDNPAQTNAVATDSDPGDPADPLHAAPTSVRITPPEANGSETGFDADDSTRLSFVVTPEFSLGAKVDVEIQAENNLDLDPDDSDFLLEFQPELSLAALYQPSPQIDVFAEIELTYSTPLRDTTDEEQDDARLGFKEGYVLLREFPVDAVSLQIGRQRFKDRREWLIDERLDAVRIIYEQLVNGWPLTVEFSVSSMLIDPDDHEDEITNFLLMGTYAYSEKEKISGYLFARDDRGDDNRDPIYFGLSWRGRPHKKHRLWLDTAILFGEDEGRDLLGYAVDAGWTLRLKHDLDPAVTLAFAYGSGDSDPDRGTDHNFQQSDLQDNNGKFNGNTKFKYYGEVFDPELSNLMIFTFGFGIEPNDEFSLDVVYHYSMLVELTDELRKADVDEDLTGDDKDLGHEVDLIIGVIFNDHFQASFTTGVFFPGSAFEEHDPAFRAMLEFQVSF